MKGNTLLLVSVCLVLFVVLISGRDPVNYDGTKKQVRVSESKRLSAEERINKLLSSTRDVHIVTNALFSLKEFEDIDIELKIQVLSLLRRERDEEKERKRRVRRAMKLMEKLDPERYRNEN